MNYLEQIEQKSMTMHAQRQHVRRYFANANALEATLADIADGVKVTDIAKRLNISYHALYSVLTGTYSDQYKAARAAYAEILAEKNLNIADKIERAELPPDAGKAAVGIRQWHMERTAGEQWGQRSSVDVTHKGVVGLHLEAIRQLAGETLEGEYEEAGTESASRRGSDGSDSVDSAVHDGDDGDSDMDRENDSGLKGEHLL